MFLRLHRQMTLFCTFITSLIIIALTFICLFISENGLRKNADASFLKEVNAMITHLQGQDTISLQWVNQIQENNHFELYFYDNGNPLYLERLYSDTLFSELAEDAAAYAKKNGLDISTVRSGILPVHMEFSLTAKDGTACKVSTGVIPRGKNSLGFVVLYPLSGINRQILFQRLLFAAADVLAILLLSVFAWFFTGRMLLPLETNRRKQTDFISAASHELRAPLTVILSGADALKKAEAPAEREHFLSIIHSEGRRMQHLISDMLFLARSDSGSFPVNAKTVQPDLLLIEAFEKYELYARKKKLVFRLSLPEDQLPPCLCDPERIAQIFAIFIDNAISYTPEGGAVTLSLTVNRKRTMLLFGVSDTGPGIPDAEKELVFDRFYRSEQSHTDKNHFGLGLCIAKEIADAHHGRLRIEDSPEGGACFLLALPAV